MHLADEVLDHLFGDFEIGDDAVAHGPDRLDVAGRAAQHHLGVVADRADLLLAALDHGDGDDRGLVEDDAASLHIDQRVRRAEIDGHVARQHADVPMTRRLRRHAAGAHFSSRDG
jgi:hypothetical protein